LTTESTERSGEWCKIKPLSPSKSLWSAIKNYINHCCSLRAIYAPYVFNFTNSIRANWSERSVIVKKTHEYSYSSSEELIYHSLIDTTLQNLIEWVTFTDDPRLPLLSHTTPTVYLWNA